MSSLYPLNEYEDIERCHLLPGYFQNKFKKMAITEPGCQSADQTGTVRRSQRHSEGATFFGPIFS